MRLSGSLVETASSNQFYNLYRKGLIAPWYLKPAQREFYIMLQSARTAVAVCHRRFGKGTTVLTHAFSKAVQIPKFLIRYGAPTQKQAHEIVDILMDHIYEPFPEAKPRWRDGYFYWPNDSRMYLFGCADAREADKGRGPEAHMIIADEYAFWAYRPEYMIKSVLSPQLDTTNGQLIITSTPPDDLTHPYIMEVARARAGGYLFEWNIDKSLECGHVSAGTHAQILERLGGENTDDYRREYKCDMIADRARLIIPEAADDDAFVGYFERPPHVRWVAMFDFGFRDFTAGIWGYLDFLSGKMVIEKEYFRHYQSTSEMVKDFRDIETRLGIEPGTPIIRRGDCSDAQQIYDMRKDHGYDISPISKRSEQSNIGFKESVINNLRLHILQKKILINKEITPNTYLQLKFSIWNERRTDFQRTEALGHGDLLMTMAYLVDNLSWTENPYPKYDAKIKESSHFVSPSFKKLMRGIKGSIESIVGQEKN